MPEDAVLETVAPLTDTTETTSVETTDATLETPVDETGAEDTQVEKLGSDAPLLKQARGALDKLKAEDPALARKMHDALARDQELSKALPEGVRAAVALRSEVASLAEALNDPTYQGAEPKQILADVKSQLGYFHELDGLFTSGSKEFTDKMADASPEAFQQHAPYIFAKYAELNPDGYSAYVAQAVVGHMNTNDVPMHFKIIDFALGKLPDSPEKAELVASLQKVYGWTEALRAMAAKKVEAPQKKVDFTQKETELADKELTLTRKEWNTSVARYGNQLMAEEFQRLSGNKQISNVERTKAINKAIEEINARLEGDRRFRDDMDAYLRSGNQDGYVRRMRSEYKKLIPGACSRAYGDIVQTPKAPAKAPAKTAAKTAAKTDTTTTDKDFRVVTKYPTGLVDVRRTTPSMMAQRMYILKDGSKVKYVRG